MTAPYNTSLPTNLAEYAEPDLYDLEKQEFAPDGPFFLALAQRIGGPVLDLGCGTGRITIPLAHHGLACTGLDAVPKCWIERVRKPGT